MATGYIHWPGKDGVVRELQLRVKVKQYKHQTWTRHDQTKSKAGTPTAYTAELRGYSHRVYKVRGQGMFIKVYGKVLAIRIVDKQQ